LEVLFPHLAGLVVELVERAAAGCMFLVGDVSLLRVDARGER